MRDMVETIKLEEGKVTMCDMPILFVFTKSVYYMQKELEGVLGEKWKRMMYECGKNDAMITVSGFFTLFQNEDKIKELLLVGKPDPLNKAESMQFFTDQFNKMGLGRVEMAETDTKKLSFVLRFYFSPVAQAYLEHEKSTEPVCHYFSGLWSGASSTFYPGLEAFEKKCMSRGDPYCEFEVKMRR